MTLALSGATRVIAIVGDPIAQVKSPAGVTQALIERGRNAGVVPLHVAAGALDAFMHGLSVAHNVDGIIATIPHKFAAYRHCTSASERARILGAANILRRNADGTWHGEFTLRLAQILRDAPDASWAQVLSATTEAMVQGPARQMPDGEGPLPPWKPLKG